MHSNFFFTSPGCILFRIASGFKREYRYPRSFLKISVTLWARHDVELVHETCSGTTQVLKVLLSFPRTAQFTANAFFIIPHRGVMHSSFSRNHTVTPHVSSSQRTDRRLHGAVETWHVTGERQELARETSVARAQHSTSLHTLGIRESSRQPLRVPAVECRGAACLRETSPRAAARHRVSGRAGKGVRAFGACRRAHG